MANAAPGQFDFNNAPLFIFQEGKQGRCSIVKVHSLYQDKDGKVLYQEGVGWVVYAQHYMGLNFLKQNIYFQQVVTNESGL